MNQPTPLLINVSSEVVQQLVSTLNQLSLQLKTEFDNAEQSIRHNAFREVLSVFRYGIEQAGLLNGIAPVVQRLTMMNMSVTTAIREVLAQATIDRGRKLTPDEEEALTSQIKGPMGNEYYEGMWLGKNPEMDHLAFQMMQWIASEPRFQNAMIALHGAVLKETWTCFEILAGDLWVACVNESPNELAKRAHTHLPPDRRISFDDLARCRFDLRTEMGSVLRTRFSFAALKDISAAYLNTFDGPTKVAIKAILKNERLYTLEKLRHLLTHRAGKVDSAFLKSMSEHPNYCKLKVGETVVVDDARVSHLKHACGLAGISLVRTADEWLRNDGQCTELETSGA